MVIQVKGIVNADIASAVGELHTLALFCQQKDFRFRYPNERYSGDATILTTVKTDLVRCIITRPNRYRSKYYS